MRLPSDRIEPLHPLGARALRRLAWLRVALCGLLVVAAGTGPWCPGRVALADPRDERAATAELVAAARAGRWDEAARLAAGLLAPGGGARQRPLALYYASEAAWHLRRYGECLDRAEAYLQEFPREPGAARLRLRRGEAFFRLGRATSARTALEAVLASAPTPDAAARARSLLARIDPVERTVRGHVVLDYDGKYVGDARLVARIAEVERVLPEALAQVARALGEPQDPTPPFRVRFRDTGARTESLLMVTANDLVLGVQRPAIEVRTERLVVGYDLRAVLAHELVHVWQRHRLGEAASAVPVWAREGSAMWVAGQGPHRLLTDLWGSVGTSEADPASVLIDGLAGRHDVRDYAEDALAFAWLEERVGADGVRTLLRRVLAGADLTEQVATAVGKPYPEALVEARAWAEAHVRAHEADRQAYLAVRRRLTTGPPGQAVAAYDAFLATAAENLYLPKARMDRAVALARAGRAREALEAFDEVERSPSGEVFAGEILEQRVRLAAARRDLPSLEVAGGRFLKDFSWVDRKRLASVREVWARAGGTPPPEPPEAPLTPDDDEEYAAAR